MDFNFGISNSGKYFAGFGAFAAALFGFLKPNDYATAFDAAIAEIRSLRFRFDGLTEAQRGERFDTIVRLMAFKYHGVLPRPAPLRDPNS